MRGTQPLSARLAEWVSVETLARTLAFAASASFTIVFIFMDASAAILRAATGPPRAADECLGRCLAFSVHPVISEVPKVILYATADALTMTDLGVKANLDPTTWAGAFDCSACGRKRLPAVEFSKNMVLKRQKDENAKIRCKTCTAADEVKEREAAAAKAKARAAEETGGDVVLHECAKCKESKPASDFSGKQLRQKGPGKQRCSACLAAEQDDAPQGAAARADELAKLRTETAKAEKQGTAASFIASVKETNKEAELVTGLKAVRIGPGRGRGRGRGANPNSVLGRGGRGGRGK